jgi:hypothetical protein
VPEGELIDWEMEGERVNLIVSEVVGHQMVELAFDD